MALETREPKNLQKKETKKIWLKNIAKSCDIEIHDRQKYCSNLLSNPDGGYLALEAQKTGIATIDVKKLKKVKNCRKNAKICDVKTIP